MKPYRLTRRARKDLDDIASFVAADNKDAALRLLERIEARCEALAIMPGTGRVREELAPGLRSAVVGKYIIFYRSRRQGIDVIRILHGNRDIPKSFQ